MKRLHLFITILWVSHTAFALLNSISGNYARAYVLQAVAMFYFVFEEDFLRLWKRFNGEK